MEEAERGIRAFSWGLREREEKEWGKENPASSNANGPKPLGREGGCRRLGTVSVLSPLCLFLLLLFLPQLKSSLGTNILSAMAAFAGTAILLMDFGVTNWVCWQMSQGVINPER
jgi:hypothetical protein